MGYANVCNADNLQQYTDPYFHGISLSEIHSYLSGAGDTTRRTSTGNLFPTLSAGSTKVLPISTPFKLTASLTAPPAASTGWLYAWEEFDLGPAAQLVAPDDGMIPLVRSTNSTSATRLFGVPDISNPTNVANRLPSLARSSHFRVTVRRPGATGGTVLSQTLPLQFTAAAGPFKVTSPNGTPIYAGRNSVTWDVANTSAAPVGVTQVNILLSTDGGKTFPTVLANSTANNGSAEVTLPVAATAILRVESIGNYFFADSAATPIQ